MSHTIRSYAELLEFVRVSLRTQHPEWIAPNGDSPICDSYQARLEELIGLTDPRQRETFARSHPVNRRLGLKTDEQLTLSA